jgi:hypothetical protein
VRALVVTEMAEVGAAEMDLGRVATRVEAASVAVAPVAAVARAEATVVAAALEASMVGVAGTMGKAASGAGSRGKEAVVRAPEARARAVAAAGELVPGRVAGSREGAAVMEAVMAALLEMAEVIVVAARAGAAAGTAGTAAMAGTAAGTEHEGDSRSSRYRKSRSETVSRAHHLDRSRRRHTRTYWCS